jgi:hypothetical protein
MTYIIFRLLHNLFDLCQVSLSKTAKHWDSFFTHCTSPVLSWCCAPTYASPISPPSLFVPTGPLYRLYRTNFGRCRDLDA